jgi:hypothetical protein
MSSANHTILAKGRAFCTLLANKNKNIGDRRPFSGTPEGDEDMLYSIIYYLTLLLMNLHIIFGEKNISLDDTHLF